MLRSLVGSEMCIRDSVCTAVNSYFCQYRQGGPRSSQHLRGRKLEVLSRCVENAPQKVLAIILEGVFRRFFSGWHDQVLYREKEYKKLPASINPTHIVDSRILIGIGSQSCVDSRVSFQSSPGSNQVIEQRQASVLQHSPLHPSG